MNVDTIVETLKDSGKVIAIKTDTVYGLVCNAYDDLAVKKIYSIKNREAKKPLAIFIKDESELRKYVVDSELTPLVEKIVKKYWPGALTLILKKKKELFKTFSYDTIGIRIPDSDKIRCILDKVDFPLAQTSCNISGENEYKNAEEIREKIGKDIDLIVDDGEITNNKPSTVITIKNDKIVILRDGAIKIDV